MEKAVALAFKTVARDSVWKELNWEGRRHSGRKFIKRGVKDSHVTAGIFSKFGFKLLHSQNRNEFFLLGGLKFRFKDLDKNTYKKVASSFLKNAPSRWKNKKKTMILKKIDSVFHLVYLVRVFR